MARPKAARPSPSKGCASGEGGCEIGELFRLLGRAHVLNILYVFTEEERGRPQRFVDLQHKLGLSPNTLSDRLKDLVAAGLLSRTAYNEIPPRVDYQATRKALDLDKVFLALHQWASSHDLAPAAEAETAKA